VGTAGLSEGVGFAGGVGLVSVGPVTAIVTACAVATALHRIIA
jgi:hypothetical protein